MHAVRGVVECVRPQVVGIVASRGAARTAVIVAVWARHRSSDAGRFSCARINLFGIADFYILESKCSADLVSSTRSHGGYKAILSETAGFRSTRNQIELEGIKRSEELARGADLIVLVLVASDADLPSWMRSIGRAVATSHLTVIDKADLVGEAHKSRLKENAIRVSSVTQEGIDCLVSTQQSAVVRQ